MAEWHLVTGEYPPQPGGVSDHTWLVAGGLAAAGDRVHVWCPPADGPTPELPGIRVHREMGGFAPSDLRRAGALLDRHPPPRRLLVQWVPHSYGRRSVNLPFCLWVLARARAGDEVEVMVHEPFLSFRAGAWRHNAAALVHRVMASVLLRAARRVWVSAPLWAEWWRPYALGRSVTFAWLSLPSNLPRVDDALATAVVRARLVPGGGVLLGHFGTYGGDLAALLEAWIPPLLADRPERSMLLLGRGGARFRESLLGRHPALAPRVHATGGLPPEDLSVHLGACDLLLQPYPAGVNARRGSLVAALQHGLPVVTTTGWLTEPFWAGSGAVALAPAEDFAAAVAAAEELIGDAARRRRLAEGARALYDASFDLRHTVASLRAEV